MAARDKYKGDYIQDAIDDAKKQDKLLGNTTPKEEKKALDEFKALNNAIGTNYSFDIEHAEQIKKEEEDDSDYFEFPDDPDEQNKNEVVILVCAQKRIYKKDLLLKWQRLNNKNGGKGVYTKDGRKIVFKNIRYVKATPKCGWENQLKWEAEMNRIGEEYFLIKPTENIKDISSIIPVDPKSISKEDFIILYKNAFRSALVLESSNDIIEKEAILNELKIFEKKYELVGDEYLTKELEEQIESELREDVKKETEDE
jgi:hypothetical protein